MISIDGSHGEGGGQILRSSLTLSIATGKPFRITNIRANRKRPGLLRQHLTAVNAATAISGARVRGDALGSRELTFEPGSVRPGDHAFAIGSAGSATLVLQTVLLPLARASEPSEIVVEGGTHNPLAPPFEFLEKSYLPLLARMGVRVEASLDRMGFAPAGGGKVRLRVHPGSLARLELEEPGRLLRRRAVATVASLPTHISQRELEVLRERLGLHKGEEVERVMADQGPGNVAHVELEYEHVTLVLTSFGERGLLAEKVAARLADEVRRVTRAEVAADEHLADQLLLPLALGEGGSFTTLEPTEHSRTHAEVIRTFLGRETSFTRLARDRWRVAIA
jgi:RNA 3'-terminal phosphate cyclase (ATP)